MITYKFNFAKNDDIFNHLKICNASFIPPLSQKVDIENYSQKIYDNADTFEAWGENKLIGLVATYCNNINKSAFITSVSVIKTYTNRGVGSKLLEDCIKYVEGKGFREITLEVNIQSKKARSLYKKLNFQEVEFDNKIIIMRYQI